MLENGKNRVFIRISLQLGEIEKIEVIHQLMTFTYNLVLAVFIS